MKLRDSGGKGDVPRKVSAAQQDYDNRWDAIFAREPTLCLKEEGEDFKEFGNLSVKDAADKLSVKGKTLHSITEPKK